jgi:hypothetical protein
MIAELSEHIGPIKLLMRKAQRAAAVVDEAIRKNEDARIEERTRLAEEGARKAELLQKIAMARQTLASLCDGDRVEWWTAAKFIEESTWWLRHPSGNPVRAPRFKWRLIGQDPTAGAGAWDEDWKIEFGANSFHVGRAICRCAESLNHWLDDREKEGAVSKHDLRCLRHELADILSGSVSNKAGKFYADYSGRDDEFPYDLVFGVQSIDVRDFKKCFLDNTGLIACIGEERLKEAGLF